MKVIIIILILLFSSKVFSNETISQQIDRLEKEISTLSNIIYNSDTSSNYNDAATNLSAIDMRIYDLENDIKNIVSQIEEIIFMIVFLN